MSCHPLCSSLSPSQGATRASLALNIKTLSELPTSMSAAQCSFQFARFPPVSKPSNPLFSRTPSLNDQVEACFYPPGAGENSQINVHVKKKKSSFKFQLP